MGARRMADVGIATASVLLEGWIERLAAICSRGKKRHRFSRKLSSQPRVPIQPKGCICVRDEKSPTSTAIEPFILEFIPTRAFSRTGTSVHFSVGITHTLVGISASFSVVFRKHPWWSRGSHHVVVVAGVEGERSEVAPGCGRGRVHVESGAVAVGRVDVDANVAIKMMLIDAR